MFFVMHKKTGDIRAVYGMNGLYFIMWDAVTGSWISDHMNNYQPVEEKR